jgi:hypothetical protein
MRDSSSCRSRCSGAEISIAPAALAKPVSQTPAARGERIFPPPNSYPAVALTCQHMPPNMAALSSSAPL